MTYEKIRLEAADGLAVITLADPATLNAAGLDMARELAHAFGSIAANKVARAVILTGEGRGFCSGANLSGGGAAGREPDVDGKLDAGSALESTYNPLVDLLHDFPLPIVTAVNGAAAGIGCSLALLGDIVVAAESAYFL
jgi:2-(1,2-epoxy-1,2-dihydrophenyl)acetyl-CoA isomerase